MSRYANELRALVYEAGHMLPHLTKPADPKKAGRELRALMAVARAAERLAPALELSALGLHPAAPVLIRAVKRMREGR